MGKEKISGSGNIGPAKGMQEKSAPNKKAFESYMQEPSGVKGANEDGGNVSPMELAKEAAPTVPGETPTVESLSKQLEKTSVNFQEIQKKLNSPNLNFKRSENYLIKNKLTETNDHLKAAARSIGADEVKPTQLPPGAGPIAKFLGMAADSQNQLEITKQQLSKIASNQQTLQPSKMLLIQVKLAQAQQEMEYTSVLLSQVIRAVQQTLNTQL